MQTPCADSPLYPELTERQRKILDLLGISKSKDEIAAVLRISKGELEAELDEMRRQLRTAQD